MKMKRVVFIALSILLTIAGAEAKKKKVSAPTPSRDELLRAEIAATPEKAGGIYYAYPYLHTPDSLAPLPAGFEPVYISHYGRHGSRWHTTKDLYDNTLNVLRNQKKNGNLTDTGLEIMNLVKQCQKHFEGHLGELSPLGEEQHAMIANRMIKRFPGLFKDGDTIQARCSTEPRCIISMAAFSEALKENNPKIVVKRHATPADEKFIRFHTPEDKALYNDPQPWRPAFEHARDSLFSCPVTSAKIFKNPSAIKNLPKFMNNLYHVTIAVQNVTGLDVNLFPYFDKEDLFNLWKGEDHKHYIRHANSIDGDSLGPKASYNLVKDFLDRADESLAGKRTKVDLRFGHDVFLMRALATMEVEGSYASTRGIDAAARVWQTYSLTPMAANLQLTIFRNAAGEEIATVRLNERPVKIGTLPEYAPGYYSWSTLRSHWRNQLSKIKPKKS